MPIINRSNTPNEYHFNIGMGVLTQSITSRSCNYACSY